MRSFDDGDGVGIKITSHKDADDKQGTVKNVFSSNTYNTDNLVKALSVEISSNEQENKELLHYLFTKSR